MVFFIHQPIRTSPDCCIQGVVQPSQASQGAGRDGAVTTGGHSVVFLGVAVKDF